MITDCDYCGEICVVELDGAGGKGCSTCLDPRPDVSAEQWNARQEAQAADERQPLIPDDVRQAIGL